MNKKIWITASIAVALVAATVAVCWFVFSPKKPVSFDLICETVDELDPFEKTGLEISMVTLDDQRTDSENKKDRVWVTVEAVGEETVCVAQFLLDFYLYDQGWKLENATDLHPDRWTYRPLRGVSAETVREVVDKAFADRELKSGDANEDFVNGRCTYTFTETAKLEYCTRRSVIEVRYFFDFLNGGWKLEACEEAERVLSDWDILGDWVGTVGEGWRNAGWSTDYTVTVNTMAEETANITIRHRTAGKIYDGEVPVSKNLGIQFFVDSLKIKTPYSFTLTFDGSQAYLEGTGNRHDENLQRVIPEVPEESAETEPTEPSEPTDTTTE